MKVISTSLLLVCALLNFSLLSLCVLNLSLVVLVKQHSLLLLSTQHSLFFCLTSSLSTHPVYYYVIHLSIQSDFFYSCSLLYVFCCFELSLCFLKRHFAAGKIPIPHSSVYIFQFSYVFNFTWPLSSSHCTFMLLCVSLPFISKTLLSTVLFLFPLFLVLSAPHSPPFHP